MNKCKCSFSIISLTECLEAILEWWQFGKQTCTYFIWSWRSCTKRWYKFLHVFVTLLIFFRNISLDNETKPQCPLLRWRASMETPMFISASQNTTLEKPLWHWHYGKHFTILNVVLTIHKYLQQLQQVISNGGGPQFLTQGCVYAYRAASQMGGTFSTRWCEQRENHKQLVLRDCLWFF